MLKTHDGSYGAMKLIIKILFHRTRIYLSFAELLATNHMTLFFWWCKRTDSHAFGNPWKLNYAWQKSQTVHHFGSESRLNGAEGRQYGTILAQKTDFGGGQTT